MKWKKMDVQDLNILSTRLYRGFWTTVTAQGTWGTQ